MAAYSGSHTIFVNTSQTQVSPGDIITIEFVSEYVPTSKNYTASLSQGSLSIDVIPPLNGAFPFATSSASIGNFVTGTQSPNVLILNESLSSFYGSYIQVPIFESGSGNNITLVSSSLYYKYLDINHPFQINQGDFAIIRGVDGRIQEAVISSVDNTVTDGLLRIYLGVDLNLYFIDNPGKIDTLLIIKKIPDEQNIILQYKKPPGATSYGFVISEDVDPTLVANIATIQSNVQTQLLSTQQNTSQ